MCATPMSYLSHGVTQIPVPLPLPWVPFMPYPRACRSRRPCLRRGVPAELARFMLPCGRRRRACQDAVGRVGEGLQVLFGALSRLP